MMRAGRSCTENLREFSRPEQNGARRHCVLVRLTDEQMAAAEGWRSAHGIAEQSEAMTELIRLGLLSEIAKIFWLVSDETPEKIGQLADSAMSEVNSPMLQKLVQTE